MIVKMYSLFDRKAVCYTDPFYAKHDGEAFRTIEPLVLDASTKLCLFPEDFVLMQVGEFDTVTGLVTPVPVRQVMDVSTMKKSVRERFEEECA